MGYFSMAPINALKRAATSVWAFKVIALTVLAGVGVWLLSQERQILNNGKTSCPVDGEAPIGCIPVIRGVP